MIYGHDTTYGIGGWVQVFSSLLLRRIGGGFALRMKMGGWNECEGEGRDGMEMMYIF